MATPAILSINEAVSRYLLKYKLPQEDMVSYIEHACDALRELHLNDLPNLVTSKVAISALGIIELPTDCIGVNGLYMFVDGVKWYFTLNDGIITTTTIAGGVESQTATYGEGQAIVDPKTDTYGGVGGVNDYYYKIDWKARRIFCEGIISDIAMLEYVTSGIELTGTTYVPSQALSVIDTYLKWKESYLIPGQERFAESRERNYNNAVYKLRNLVNAMSYEQWRDTLLSVTTQAPLR
jgi:hypothetical protein